MPATIERIALFLVLVTISELSSAQTDVHLVTPQLGYSLDTLDRPIFGPAEVAVEAAKLNNWLNANYDSLTTDQYKGPREFLYYLIDSHVKNIYAREGSILPKEPDGILEALFFWSERLGVYGGSTVYNSVRSPSKPEMPLALEPPPSIAISMNGDLLRIESAPNSWGFEIPFYFMPFLVTEFTATNGMPTQFLAISTGAATDSSEDGRSQATLMLIYCADVDFLEFKEFWTGQLSIPTDAKETELGVEQLTTRYYFNDTTKIHTETLIWPQGSGAFAMTYGGVDGTYQWNRQHFLDFFLSLQQSQ